MNTKYKKGVDKYDHLAVCKIDRNELLYNPDNHLNLKQYLSKKGVKDEDYLKWFDIVGNPYKNVLKCHCRLCDTSYKDPDNKSGQLTIHIQKAHNTSIAEYTRQFPEDIKLFQYKIKSDFRVDETLSTQEERIQCPLCHQYFKSIRNTHVKKHNLTIDEFRKVTGLQVLSSEKFIQKSREIYYSEDGLGQYKRPVKIKQKKEKKNKQRKSIKEYVSGVDYPVFEMDVLLRKGCQFIYKITSPSGKCYIGRTKNFFKRMDTHKKYSEKSLLSLYCAVRKYGWDSMVKEIIEVVEPGNNIKEVELKWIDFFDSYYNGYNNTRSTEGGHNWEGKKDTEQYKAYIALVSSQSKGRGVGSKRSDETKAKLSTKSKGRHTLQWFQEKYGEEVGAQKYKERSEMLRNRKDQKRDANGKFIPIQ